MATQLPPIDQVKKDAGTATTSQPDLTGLTGAERQLAIERAAGIPSFRRPAPGVPVEQTTQNLTPVKPKSFSQNVIDKANDKLKEKRGEMLNADTNFDTQLLLQKGALVSALLQKNLTPEELRWLSPNAQRAIREGDKAGIEAYLGGINSIFEERRTQQDEADAKKEKELQRLQDRFAMISKYGLWGSLSEEDSAQLEDSMGLSPGSLKTLGEDAKKGETEYQLIDGPNSSKYLVGLNKTTGESTKPITVIAGKATGSDSGVSSGYSGKFSKDELRDRAEEFVEEQTDGSIRIRWDKLDSLEDTDRNLWHDMSLYVTDLKTSSLSPEVSTPDPTEEPFDIDAFLREDFTGKKPEKSDNKLGGSLTERGGGGLKMPPGLRWLFE